MQLYDNYIQNIRNVISQGKLGLNEGYQTIEKGFNHYNAVGASVKIMPKKFSISPSDSLQPLISAVGNIRIQDQKLGEHPDFKYLKENYGSEYHYITSAFIDIKNSTGLFRRYSPDIVMEITNTIQKAAIHTCLIFGGYIHRLQGDGVFVYFGGKTVTKKQSAISALNATSLFTYFVKNDLKKVFENEGVEDIYTRIGIDFGDDDKVLWSVAGIGDCSEVTTYSLHTSLASKMQGIANSNGIVVGDYVKSVSLLDNSYFNWVKDYTGEIRKRYIYEDQQKGFYYKALNFNWSKYLKSLPFIYQNSDGELFYKPVNFQTGNNENNILKQTAALISSGNAYTDNKGNISNNMDGIKNQTHRFHYEE